MILQRCTTALGLLVLLAGAARAADKWENLTKESHGLSGNEVQFIEADANGTVWIGTRSGLTAYANGKLSVALESGEIWDVLQVDKDKFWIGAGHGAIFRSGGKDELTLKGATVAPILPYKDKAVWAIKKDRGTEQNLVVENQGDEWKVVEKFKEEKVVDLLKTSNGSMWVVVDGNGVYEVDPEKGVDNAVHHLEGSNVTTLFEDSKNQIWFGLWEGGVACLHKGQWTRHLKKEKSFIFGIREDGKGAIWVATNQNGLWRSQGEEWVNDLKEEGGINLLVATSDGRIWISAQMQGGLRYWDGKKWQLSLDSPFPIRCVFETRDKQVWAGGVLDGIHIKK